MQIDLSFSQAAIVLPREYSALKFILIGAGGTGSFAAPAIARLVFELKQIQNKPNFRIICLYFRLSCYFYSFLQLTIYCIR